MTSLRPPPLVVALGKAVSRRARKWPLAASLVDRVRTRSRNALLEVLPNNAVCAEIGVWKGGFSQRILDDLKPRELHLIDPWVYFGTSTTQWHGGSGGQVTGQADMDRVFLEVRHRFEGRREVTIHRATSQDAVGSFPDSYFDWVYIDGDHSFENVAADLRDYLPKVKPSGFLAGDDFYWAPEEDLPVKRAVEGVIRRGAARLVFQRRGQWAMQRI